MKTLTMIITSLLLLSIASAAVITVDNNHVFEGEEFTVTYTANTPLSQQDMSITVSDQTKIVTLPTMTVGSFSTTVSFVAPQVGEYEIVSGDTRTVLNVEPALLVLKDVSIKPSSIAPRETARLSYTLENEGDLRVYNVKSRVIIPTSDQFSYNNDQQELYSIMAPGEKMVQAKEIRARENAAGETNIEIGITYEYDNEIHKRTEWVTLGVTSFDWALGGLVTVLIIIVAGFAFSRTVERRGE